ncbi:hemicentin-1 [Myripristis murdjan]|uniref:hemicentin-1 n=1 Tax=Myripristis murdjan TaxID=586833 RepID=UPI001175E6A5|nr:intercellular adhesion molecule 5 [Myripristis murdjan]
MVLQRSSMLPLRVVGLLVLMLSQSDADSTCEPEEKGLTLNPPEIVVEYGQPVEVNCSTPTEDYELMQWITGNITSNKEVKDDTSLVTLMIPEMLDWDAHLQCKISLSGSHECRKDLLPTVYKNPEGAIIFAVSYAPFIEEGTQYELQCDIINVAPVQNLIMKWYRGNQTILTDRRSHNTTKIPVSTSSNLMINATREENGIQFRCEAQLDFGAEGPQTPVISSDPLMLNVHYKPVVQCQSNFTCTEHDWHLNMTEHLPCEVDWNPSGSITWYHQGKLVNHSMPLTRMDSGEYDYVATNNLGSFRATINIIIEYAPEFLNPNKNLQLAMGMDLHEDCDVDGQPVPEVQWAYDAEGLNKVNTMENQSILSIRGLNTSTTFYCIATNKLGNASMMVHVEVIIPSAATTEQPAAAMPNPMTDAPKDRCPLQLMPARLVVQYGDPASVNCSTSSTDPAGMGWEARKGGTGFHDEARFVLWKVEELKDWTLEPLCYITLFDNEQCKKRASVTLYKNPDDVSVSLLEQGPMKEGSEYHLQCNITSVAPVQNLTVSWHKGNEVLKTESFNNTERTPEDVASFLSFTPRSHDNGVNLECRAQLSFGLETLPPSVSAEYSAEVYYKPFFEDCPHHYTGVEQRFNLSMVPCQVHGNPPSNIQWHYYGAPFNASVTLTRIHSGTFILEAVNTMGTDTTSINIKVEYRPEFNCSDHYEVKENDVHQNPCKPEGEPEPSMIWLKDGKEMSFPEGLTRRNSGQYTLRARNEHGEAYRSLSVDVLYAPEFEQGNCTKEITSGDDVTLNCSTEGNPSPVLQWTFISADGLTRTTRGNQSSINIIRATSTSAGIYICVATNKVGRVTRFTTLIMKEKSYALYVVSAVVLLFLVVLLILWYHRKRSRYRQYDVANASNNGSDIPMTTQHTEPSSHAK